MSSSGVLSRGRRVVLCSRSTEDAAASSLGDGHEDVQLRLKLERLQLLREDLSQLTRTRRTTAQPPEEKQQPQQGLTPDPGLDP